MGVVVLLLLLLKVSCGKRKQETILGSLPEILELKERRMYKNLCMTILETHKWFYLHKHIYAYTDKYIFLSLSTVNFLNVMIILSVKGYIAPFGTIRTRSQVPLLLAAVSKYYLPLKWKQTWRMTGCISEAGNVQNKPSVFVMPKPKTAINEDFH